VILDLDGLSLGAERTDLRLQPDICIVGGGAIGLSLAASLSASGRSVLVLEGGGERLETASQALQQGFSVGHPYKNIDVGRYRVLGGTTTFWGGQLYPFDRFVTDERPWLGHAAWPVSPGEMGHWFDASYRLLGLGDAIPLDEDVWAAIGHPRPELGADIEVVTTRWVKTRNFSRLFAPVLRSASGPHVLTHANVIGLKLDAGRRRVESATVRSLRGRLVTIRARRFVLANGTLEISRLLLHPLADGSEAPWAGNSFLGTPLVDHLDCIAGEVHVLDHKRFHDMFDNVYIAGHKYYPKMRLARSTQLRERLVDVAAQFQYRTRFSEHLDYLKMYMRSVRDGSGGVRAIELPRHLAAVAATSWPLAVRYFKDRRSFKPRDAKVSLVLYAEQLPTPSSRITLGSNTDAIGLRRLRVDWQIDGRELSSMRRFAQDIAAQLLRRGLARVTLDPLLASGDPAFVARVHDAIHQMGATRIGSSRDSGVVDGNLKVWDVDNLYVVGATVFPSTGFANPTLTAIALALRLARHLTLAPKA
jgi:choline dehydrogenase-like flavoprotein